jgi:hypothetical protein
MFPLAIQPDQTPQREIRGSKLPFAYWLAPAMPRVAIGNVSTSVIWPMPRPELLLQPAANGSIILSRNTLS